MDKNEMKNRISMALKDPILQQGFEIICKENAELEQENNLLKSFLYCTEKSCNNCGYVNCENFQRQRKNFCERWISFKDYIVELEKENKTVTRKANEAIADKLLITAKYNEVLNDLNQENDKLQKENAELKAKVSLSIDCEKAQKNGELCLGYGDDEDEPCEQCKNCIKCECGYYQLGETDKDEQLTKAKEIIEGLMRFCRCFAQHHTEDIRYKDAEQFLNREMEK